MKEFKQLWLFHSKKRANFGGGSPCAAQSFDFDDRPARKDLRNQGKIEELKERGKRWVK